MSSVTDLINHEIAERGIISFAQFMELALYAPRLGYYERDLRQIGRQGDFYTSVSVGPFFGELLAFQFLRWLKPLAETSRVQIVEAGAHTGQLAMDILAGLRKHAPVLLQRLDYWIVEPSESRRAVQQARLNGEANVRWQDQLTPSGPVRGVIFSNELLDAMPVHQFAWNAQGRHWEELGVIRDADGFRLARMPKTTVAAPSLPEGLLDVLPDGYVVESTPAGTRWWRNAAESLKEGFLMTIDYGGTIEELLNPGRRHGTVRAYSRHGIAPDPLRAPGDQDITAHVDFTAIRLAGEATGLHMKAFTSQSQFLTEVARELWSETGSCPQKQVRQFQTLTHPEHLGRPFRVLVQQRK